MRRIIAALLTICLIFAPFPAFSFVADQEGPKPVVIATGTIAANVLKISAVDGTAFVDPDSDAAASAAFLAAVKHNDKIVIRSRTNKQEIWGYAKLGGTGETVGADLLAAWDLTSGWTAGGTASIIDANSFSSTAAGWVYKNNIFVNHRLYKRTYAKSATGANYFHARAWNGASGNTPALSDGTDYYTANGTYVAAASTNTSAGTTDVSSMTVEQVLTPASTGITISSTPGGTTMNWSVKSSTFTYNDPLGYDWEVVSSVPNGRTAGRIIAQGTGATMNVSMAPGYYFITRSSIDFAALATGAPRQITITDTGGKKAVFGGLSQGTGETLGAELVDAWTNYAIAPYDTLTPGAGSDVTAISDGVGASIASTAIAASAGALYVNIRTVAINSGTGPAFYYASSVGLGGGAVSFGTGTTTDTYRTAAAYTHFGFQNLNTVAGNFSITGHSLKKVLTPDLSGVQATSLTVESGFNPNSATFSYLVEELGAIPITASAMHASMVNGTAFFFHDSIDFSGFAVGPSGKYLVAAYDSTGRVAWGYGKAAGDGGTVPITGLTITSTPGGTTYDWAYIASGFASDAITSVKIWRAP